MWIGPTVPSRFDAEGLLHDWDGLPAAEWRNGKGLYFWHGVEMTESAGRDPDAVTPSRVLGWANAERRRVALERIGLERFMRAVGAEVVKSVTPGQMVVKIVHDELIHVLAGDGEPDALKIDNPPATNLMVAPVERAEAAAKSPERALGPCPVPNGSCNAIRVTAQG